MYIISYCIQHDLLDESIPPAQPTEKQEVDDLPGRLVPSGVPVPIPKVCLTLTYSSRDYISDHFSCSTKHKQKQQCVQIKDFQDDW